MKKYFYNVVEIKHFANINLKYQWVLYGTKANASFFLNILFK